MTFIARARAGIAELKARDPGLTVFGAKGHRYAFGATLSEEDVADLPPQTRNGLRGGVPD
jgi:hypothetical protein